MMYDPALPRSRVFLPAMLSGLLLYLCFFPVNTGFLGWIAIVPLLSLVRANARPRRIYFATFVGGLLFYVPAISWMRVAHPAMYASWLFLAFCCALFLVMTMWIVRRLDRVGVPFWVAVPVGFVAVEYFRSHFPTGYTWLETVGLRNPIGFGWYMVGHTQHDWLSLIQMADVTGVYGLTFLVAMVNAVLWLGLEQTLRVRKLLRLRDEIAPTSIRPSLVAAALLVAAVAYGHIRLGHAPFADGPQVALIQGNLPQDIKNTKGDEMERHFGQLAKEAVRPPADHPAPDLVIWPETSLVFGWYDLGPGADIATAPQPFRREYNLCRLDMERLAEHWKTPMLYGLNTYQWEADDVEWRYNSALLVDTAGKPVVRYDKIHLVPFGEYVPLEKYFPFMTVFTPYDKPYSCKPGEHWSRFPIAVGDRTYHFACVICYEDTDDTLARQYVRPSADGVDFIVNISNDGWFDGTAEHEQHLAISRFRAVESRRSIVRAVNMGISAIIDPDGRVVALPGETWAKSKKVSAIVRGPVPIDTRTSLYARLGDWLPILTWAIVLGGFVRGSIRRWPAAKA
jgi:apolipoprotein N-acyltransferase